MGCLSFRKVLSLGWRWVVLIMLLVHGAGEDGGGDRFLRGEGGALRKKGKGW